MSHEMRNPWAEYVKYREEKTKKIRIPTRPKKEMPQLAAWLRGLSTEMRDLGHERQASCIHEEIAELYLAGKNATVADRNEARKEYLMAARLSARGEDARREQIYLTPLTSASCEDLFNKAIHLSMQMNDLKMAGLTAFEAATATKEWKHNGETSVAFLERSIRLLEGEVNTQSTAYFHLILSEAEGGKWWMCLSLLDDLWMIVMKSRQDSLLVESSLIECEIMTALIICMMSPSEVAGRHKCIHDLYSKLHPVEVHFALLEEGRSQEAEEYRQQVQSRSKRNHQWNAVPEESCLGEELFWLVKDIVWMIYYGETDNLTATMEDKEAMRTFPEHSKKLIPLVSDGTSSEDVWILPHDPSRLQLQLIKDKEEKEENKKEEEETEEDKKRREEKTEEEEKERSWRMGRFMEDNGLEYGDKDIDLPTPAIEKLKEVVRIDKKKKEKEEETKKESEDDNEKKDEVDEKEKAKIKDPLGAIRDSSDESPIRSS
ncbi:hypothetical protein PENTCL1PPCAC_27003 [Pristionchus entomophagus]|uniref:Uncharacterized protein n=1 Tax=Pristionchus entomophagus TaxID=358040 RepID=A0AAV5UEK3_9BILA|nr:hypothetical protein PENTCL1PPCAC_27003 [Pristionchus entomophagus]